MPQITNPEVKNPKIVCETMTHANPMPPTTIPIDVFFFTIRENPQSMSGANAIAQYSPTAPLIYT
jgi:hypothetical protein